MLNVVEALVPDIVEPMVTIAGMSVLAIVGAGLRTWAPVASAAFGAVAAGASLASIVVGRRQWLVAQKPYLVGQLMRGSAGAVALEIRNIGAGGAYGVRSCVALGTEYMPGYARPGMSGFLNTDEAAAVITEYPWPSASGQPRRMKMGETRGVRVEVDELWCREPDLSMAWGPGR